MQQEGVVAARLAPHGGRDDQIRRTARVLEIIQQIAVAPGQWSRKELARHHEISERMIQKDIELIRYRLGLELDHDGSTYSFSRLPHLPAVAYSFNEAIAMVTAVRAAQTVPGVNSADLAAAVARLECIFPEQLQPLMREAADQLPAEAGGTHRHAMLTLFHRAWIEQRRVRMQYATGSRNSDINERDVEPYYVLPYGRSWYLVAWDSLRETILDFKLDRVRQARLLDTTYTIPADFDIDDYLGDNWGMLRGVGPEAERIVLLFSPEAGRWVSESQWHKSQEVNFLPNGRVRVEFFLSATPEMVRWLLYYGADVFVEQPGWLREQVREAHRAAAEGGEADA